ncbi:MAG TPA: hypothetical protein VGS19_24940 [Streptosporangiaceae bacterium]|nr:hypothetical protein [Streptosporangiaceae bacterium]
MFVLRIAVKVTAIRLNRAPGCDSHFLTLQTNAQGQVMGVQELGGWYQNGGSWFLWTYLAEYAAARSGDTAAAADIQRSVTRIRCLRRLELRHPLDHQTRGQVSVIRVFGFATAPLWQRGLKGSTRS